MGPLKDLGLDPLIATKLAMKVTLVSKRKEKTRENTTPTR